MALTYLIYSGIGGAMKDVTSTYIGYYIIFTASISLGILLGLNSTKRNYRNSKWEEWNSFLNYFIESKSIKIISIYYVIILLDLIVPEFKLLNLIHPPSPDLRSVFDARYNGPEETYVTTSLLTFARQLLYPFFLLSLYKYRYKTIKLTFLVLGTYYIPYCGTGYIGRGSMLEALIIIMGFTYVFRPKLGKKLIIVGIVSLPLLIIFLVQYSITRIGGTANDISVSEASEILFSQEGGYPKHFSQILKMSNHPTLNYIIWLLTMPLPGIFRGGIDVKFNVIFSEYMLGVARGDTGFFILLPGLVGESVFLCGKNLFFFNGLLYGYLIGFLYKTLTKHKQLFGILIVAIIDLSYVANRGGLVSAIPFVLKILIYFYLILLYYKYSYNKKKFRFLYVQNTDDSI